MKRFKNKLIFFAIVFATSIEVAQPCEPNLHPNPTTWGPAYCEYTYGTGVTLMQSYTQQSDGTYKYWMACVSGADTANPVIKGPMTWCGTDVACNNTQFPGGRQLPSPWSYGTGYNPGSGSCPEN